MAKPDTQQLGLKIQKEAHDFDRMMSASRAKKASAPPAPTSRHPMGRMAQRLRDAQGRSLVGKRR